MTTSYSPVPSSHDLFHRESERSDFEEEAYCRWRNEVRELGMVLSGVVISTACPDLLPTTKDIPALLRRLTLLIDWYEIPKSVS